MRSTLRADNGIETTRETVFSQDSDLPEKLFLFFNYLRFDVTNFVHEHCSTIRPHCAECIPFLFCSFPRHKLWVALISIVLVC